MMGKGKMSAEELKRAVKRGRGRRGAPAAKKPPLPPPPMGVYR